MLRALRLKRWGVSNMKAAIKTSKKTRLRTIKWLKPRPIPMKWPRPKDPMDR